MKHLGASCITARTTVRHRLLSSLVARLQAEGVDARLVGDDLEVIGAATDAEAIEPDDLFICGGPPDDPAVRQALARAIEHGAAAYLCAGDPADLAAAASDVPALVVDDVERAAAILTRMMGTGQVAPDLDRPA